MQVIEQRWQAEAIVIGTCPRFTKHDALQMLLQVRAIGQEEEEQRPQEAAAAASYHTA